MQTGREAIATLLQGGQADHVPVHDNVWSDAARKWVGQGMPARDDGSPTDVLDHFGFDIVTCGGGVDWQPKRGVADVLDETDEWRVVRNGAGAVLKWWKHRSGTPEHIEFDMSSREVWERDYRPLLVDFDPGRVGDTAAVARSLAHRREQGKWAAYGSVFIWEYMRASMGDYTMYMALATEPDWIHDFCRVYTDLYLKAAEILVAEAGPPDGVWLSEDLGYRDRLFCRPETLAELIFPYYAEVVAFYHAHDVPVILHSCGYQEPALPLVVEAGFDALNPMEVKAGNDIFAFAERYGDDLVFIGGLDARILECGDRERTRDGILAFLDGMRARNARFVYGSDHSLSTNIDYEDLLYALEVYRAHMMN
ncbi:hypothetical protein CMK11_02615 [Candidatus Poribacteria bacterium]|nr:hypothetical protein [Candidatus Poribacteria bacterium]